MRNIRISIFFIAIALTGALVSQAQQGEVKMTASLAAGIPIGQLKEQAGKTSLRGFDVSILYGINDKLSIGLNAGFQDFYEKFPRGIYKLEDGSDISAVLSNSVQAIPVLASARYNFSPGKTIQPYAAVGVGGNFAMYRQFIGEYPNSYNKIGFAARPELGIYMPFRKDGYSGLNLGVNYNYLPYNKAGIDNLNYIGIKLGIAFPLRDQ